MMKSTNCCGAAINSATAKSVVASAVQPRLARTHIDHDPEITRFGTAQKFVNHDDDSSKIDSLGTSEEFSQEFVAVLDYFDNCLK